MYGRLGSIYLLNLNEAGAQRRRLARSSAGGRNAVNSASGMSIGIALRLAAVLCVGFGAIATLAAMVG
ncbi:hypothetical protein [Neorhizobium sp. NCHU2750]|uniref:hypothetical protein n=1 Tax=Neorhizobium sp. NCHU2750 TaxID=1825976 RepID=UPI000E767715|nr:hypothetical protein NCHU2750_31650 [Neorhizobium sp. NCHU2750]